MEASRADAGSAAESARPVTAAHTTPATGTIFNVQRCSFHDGPGIRTTVFLKGCPLRCPWCHNPEGIERAPEVIVSAARCLSCGTCDSVCPRPEGPLPSGERLGTGGCTSCRECFEACPSGARQLAGRRVGVAALVDELLRDRGVFDESRGGVTFSGGEPLAQPEFLLASIEACRREGLHTAVETCGFAPRGVVLAAAGAADLLLWDVKHLDPARHRELTGAPLAPILDNLAAVDAAGVPLWLRIPVVPGINDDEATLRTMARLAEELRSVRRVSLLPYHRTGAGKLARLGREDTLAGTTTPGDERMRQVAALFAETGRETTVGG